MLFALTSNGKVNYKMENVWREDAVIYFEGLAVCDLEGLRESVRNSERTQESDRDLKWGPPKNEVKVKVKFTPEQATKAQWGIRCRALHFLEPRL